MKYNHIYVSNCTMTLEAGFIELFAVMIIACLTKDCLLFVQCGVNAVITVCFSYLSRCLYKASAGDVCCDDFLVRSETFTSLNVESKDTTCTVCWSL